MASIFDGNYNLFAKRMLSPDKRMPNNMAYIKTLVSTVQYFRDIVLDVYRVGAQAFTPWAPGTYTKYYRVVHKQKVYESLKANNTAEPTDQTAWRVIADNFIGVEERAQYNSVKLVLEYAINKYFSTMFRQPLTGTSDIYFTTLQNPLNVFLVGNSLADATPIYTTGSPQFVINDFSFAAFYNLQINFPQSVFDALDPNPDNAEKIIRNFVNRIICAGITYKIVTY